MPGRIDTAALAPLEGVLRWTGGLGVAARVERATHLLRADWPERYRTYMGIVKDQEKRALYTPLFRQLCADDIAARANWDVPWEDGDNASEWMMRHDRAHYLPDCLMVKTDIASMANSLEVRCPLLDHTLVEFAATLPTAHKRDSKGGKIVLRRVAAKLLPDAVLRKPKTGFGVPLGRWLRRDLASIVGSTLLDDRVARRGMLRPAALRAMVDDHLAGRRDWSNRLWALLMLELWFRRFVD